MPENPSLDPRGIRVVDLRDLPWNFGPAIDRPADASLVKPRSAWLETDTGNGFYSDGATWQQVSAGGKIAWEDVGTGATPSGGGGIDFETYPQVGAWLYAEVNDRTGSPYGRAFEIYDKSVGSSSGIEIRSDTSEIDIDAGGQLAMSANDQIDMTAFNSALILRTTFYNPITLDSQGDINLSAPNGVITATLAATNGWFRIIDTGGGGVDTYMKIVTGPSGTIEFNSPDKLNLYSTSGYLQMQGGITELAGTQAGGLMLTAMGSADVILSSAVNGNVIIKGHFAGDGGVQGPLLKVTQDSLGQPTYHIKSGASWVADL